MKFKFLGDGDCPDWLLQEIGVMSRVPYTKVLLIAEQLCSGKNDQSLDSILNANTHLLSFDELKAVTAALDYILTSAVRNEVLDDDLQNELMQLGLPFEHSSGLSKTYQKYKKTNVVSLSAQCLRLSELSSVEVVPEEEKSPIAKVTLKMKTLNGNENATINIIKDDIPILLEELKKARSLMESLKE